MIEWLISILLFRKELSFWQILLISWFNFHADTLNLLYLPADSADLSPVFEGEEEEEDA